MVSPPSFQFVFWDLFSFCKQPKKVERSSNLVYSSAEFFLNVKNNKLPPDQERSNLLCMAQYGRVLACSRIPKPGRDETHICPDTKHIVVMHHGHFFTFNILDAHGNILAVEEIAKNLQQIIKMVGGQTSPSPIGLFTTEKRDNWTSVRTQLIGSNPLNAESIRVIDDGLLVLCLDHESPATWDEVAHLVLHSNGINRWFDKSIQLLTWANGRSGANMEHSGYDGHLLSRYGEFIHNGPYSKGIKFSSPIRQIKFELDSSLSKSLSDARARYEKRTKTMQMSVMIAQDFGKKELTSMKVSPDAFVQMAIQLAYYKQNKNFGKYVKLSRISFIFFCCSHHL